MPFRSTAGQRNNRKDDLVLGVAKFQKSLHGLDDTVVKKVLLSATVKAAAPVRKHLRNAVKPISKTMAKAIISKVKVYKRSKVAIGLIGIKNDSSVRAPYSDPKNRNRGKGDSKGIHDPRFTFHLVDLGTKPHMIPFFGDKAKMVMHPGTSAQKVREKAMRATESQQIQAYETAFKAAVDKALSK